MPITILNPILHPATTSTLGGVIIGSSITVDSDGLITDRGGSVSEIVINNGTTSNTVTSSGTVTIQQPWGISLSQPGLFTQAETLAVGIPFHGTLTSATVFADIGQEIAQNFPIQRNSGGTITNVGTALMGAGNTTSRQVGTVVGAIAASLTLLKDDAIGLVMGTVSSYLSGLTFIASGYK